VERRLSLYLRALWGREIRLRPLSRGLRLQGPRRATFDRNVVWLPEAISAAAGQSGLTLCRAAAAHAAAHIVFTRQRFAAAGLDALQVAVVSLIEDARVEHLAAREFPGLKRLWMPFHTSVAGDPPGAPSLMARLSRALIDERFEDGHQWIAKARRLFREQSRHRDDQSTSRAIGSELGGDLARMRLSFHLGGWLPEPAYRDDNAGLWDDAGQDQPGERNEPVFPGAKPGDQAWAGIDLESDDGGSAAAMDDGVPSSASMWRNPIGDDALSPAIRYDEWDYVIGRERPAWCTVLEKSATPGDPLDIDAVLERNRELVERVKYLVRAVQVQRPSRLRRRLDGDRLDLDAGIGALVDLRSLLPPEPRVYSIPGRKQRDLSVLVLLDLSQSTNDLVPGTGASVLDLAREATALLADAMDRIGDNFAIHGFSSNGRHDVGYYRFKDFDRPYGELAKSRLAGMTGQLSTRMGTALRHSGSYLQDRRAHRKLILLITDGEPSDIDVHDSQYLVLDARKAVEGLSRRGIYTYCMSLDPRADRYVSRIFGVRNWTVVDRLRRLPEKLPLLYMRLTH
jgi:hypothetical protein